MSIVNSAAVLSTLAAVLFGARDARGQAAEPPPDAMVWWSFDPIDAGVEAGAGHEASVMAADMARLADAKPEEAAEAWLGSMFSPLKSVLTGAVPTSFALLDLEAESIGESIRVHRLVAVAELSISDGHAELISAFRAGSGLGQGDAAIAFVAGGDLVGYRARSEDWPAGREVSWCSTPRSLIIGVGEGAVERWLAAPGIETPPWMAHRAIERVRQGDVVGELWVNFNAIRARSPELLARGLARRLSEGSRLGNARGLLVRARRLERGPVSVEAMWSSRSEPIGVVHGAVLAQPVWPEDWRGSSGGVSIVAGTNAPYWLSLAQMLLRAREGEWGQIEFDVAVSRWRREGGASLERVIGALAPRVLIEGPGMGALAARVPLLARGDAAGIARGFADLMASVPAHATREGDAWRIEFGGVAIWAALEPPEAPSMLILAWSPEGLEAARARGHPRR